MRKLLICIFCICLFAGAITANAADSGPVALYTFDSGDLSDSGGNGYTGVAAGAMDGGNTIQFYPIVSAEE